MSSFKNGQLILINQNSEVASPIANHVSIYTLNDKVYAKDSNGVVYEFANVSTVNSISGSLKNQIDGINGITPETLNQYTLLSVTEAISAGLNSRLDNLGDLSNININDYTLLTTTNQINSDLNTRIDNLNISSYTPLSTTSALSTDLYGQVGVLHNSINNIFSTYTNSSTTAEISAGLNSRINVNDANDVIQTNSINNIYSTYANSTTVAAISAGLNSRINVNDANDVIQTNSINNIYSTYANSTTVAAISAGLNSRINSITGGVDLSNYTLVTITQNISAGLNSRINVNDANDVIQTNSINNIYSTYANSTTVAAISAGLNNTMVHKTGDETISGIKTFTGQAYFNVITSQRNLGRHSESYGWNSQANATNSAYYNVSLGEASLFTNTVGWNNVAIGTSALYSNISGADNVAVGHQSMYSLTTEKNVAVGRDTLEHITVGSNNVAIGFEAGSNLSSPITSADKCTYIGNQTQSTANGFVNSTAIGNGATVSKSNQVVIGDTNVTETVLRGTVITSNLATKASPIAGTYNTVVVNSQGIVTSGGNVSNNANVDLSPYTLLTTTAAISAGLNSRIDAISGGGSVDLSSYTTLATTTAISANLQSQINSINISGGGSGSSIPIVTTGSGNTFSPDGLSDVYDYTISASSTVTLNAPSSIINGKTIIIKFKQPSGGNAPISLVNGTYTWKIPNASLTLSTDVGLAEDVITIVRIGSYLYTSIVKNLS